MMVTPEYGGGGMDTVSYVPAMEEISKVDSSCSVIMSVNNSLVCWGLEKYGTEEQKRNICRIWLLAKKIGAFCLRSPKPVQMLPASAPQPKTKAIITCSTVPRTGSPTVGTASVYLVMAQTHPELGPQRHQLPDRGRGMDGFV